MTEWLFIVAGWLLVATGVGLGGWALLRDRARGRRRCPRCWYDMAGVPGLRCPECGREVKSEKDLHKRRHRWGWIAVGCVLLVLGYGHIAWPSASRYGWRGIVPTSLVIAMLPRAGKEFKDAKRTQKSIFATEMRRRVEIGGLSDWQWRWALRRTDVFRTRAAWPHGEEVRVGVVVPSWVDGFISLRVDWGGGSPRTTSARQRRQLPSVGFSVGYPDGDLTIGELPRGRWDIPLDVTVQVGGTAPGGWMAFNPGGGGGGAGGAGPMSWTDSIELPITVVARDERWMRGQGGMRPVERDDFNEAVRSIMRVEIEPPGRRYHLAVVEITLYDDDVPILRDVAVAPKLELWRGMEHISTTTFTQSRTAIGIGWTNLLAAIPRSDEVPWGDDLSDWTIRIRGDSSAALGHFDLREYWAGELSIPLKDLVVPWKRHPSLR